MAQDRRLRQIEEELEAVIRNQPHAAPVAVVEGKRDRGPGRSGGPRAGGGDVSGAQHQNRK